MLVLLKLTNDLLISVVQLPLTENFNINRLILVTNVTGIKS